MVFSLNACEAAAMVFACCKAFMCCAKES